MLPIHWHYLVCSVVCDIKWKDHKNNKINVLSLVLLVDYSVLTADPTMFPLNQACSINLWYARANDAICKFIRRESVSVQYRPDFNNSVDLEGLYDENSVYNTSYRWIRFWKKMMYSVCVNNHAVLPSTVSV